MSELQQLTDEWIKAKYDEQGANSLRLNIEAAILDLCKNTLKDKGTNNLDTGLKIVTGYTEKWDQQAIDDAANAWGSALPFPFQTQYKPVKALLDIVEATDAPKFRELQKAMTLSPSKPSFSFKE